jgi:hypothetical protein
MLGGKQEYTDVVEARRYVEKHQSAIRDESQEDRKLE